MVTAENYSDIQILQGTDFLYELEFDVTHNDVNYDDDVQSPYEYRARLQKDFTNVTTFQYGGNPVTAVLFDVGKVDAYNIEITMSATDTAKFEDDFEGVWDLLEKKDLGSSVYEHTRQIQGDAVVSPMVTQPGDFG